MHQVRTTRLAIAMAACLASVATDASALPMQGFRVDATRDSLVAASIPVRPLVSRRTVVGLEAAIALTIGVAPFDRRAATLLQSPRLQSRPDLQSAASRAAFMGGPGPFLVGAGLFVGGRVLRARPVAALGVHVTEAVLLAAALDGLGKGISGRELPNQTADPDNIGFGRGFHRGNGPYVSFPSGHTAAGFAMAAALTGDAEAWHPGIGRFVAPLAYGGASLIGLARMYQNQHWASDLPLAAAIGTWSGTTVVAEARAHPHNWIDRVLLGVSAAPANHRVIVTWSLAEGAGR